MEQIQIKLAKSSIRTTPNQRFNLRGLGLSRRGKVVVRPDTASIRGMIKKVIHLVEVSRPDMSRAASKKSPAVEIFPPKEGAVKAKKQAKPKKAASPEKAAGQKKEAKASPKKTTTAAKKKAPTKKAKKSTKKEK